MHEMWERLMACHMLKWCRLSGFHRVMLETTKRDHRCILKIIFGFSSISKEKKKVTHKHTYPATLQQLDFLAYFTTAADGQASGSEEI